MHPGAERSLAAALVEREHLGVEWLGVSRSSSLRLSLSAIGREQQLDLAVALGDRALELPVPPPSGRRATR